MAPQKVSQPVIGPAFFAAIEDELHDSARVQRHGQEDDLREALSRVMTRVQELCGLLKATFQAKSDLETQLTLAQSNLKMSLANNEMLEDALKRHSASQDVGWRRAPARRTSVDETGSSDTHGNCDSESTPPTPPPLSQTQTSDSRFFRFRFSSGRNTPTQSSHPSSPPLSAARLPISGSPGHLTSASLPSLVQPIEEMHAKELERFRTKLAEESAKLARAVEDKRALESELETLSQALFEEANKMVASERIKRAEAEEELKEARIEKEALRAAMKVMESERLSGVPHAPLPSATFSQSTPDLPSEAGSHHPRSRSSSVNAIKSPRSPLGARSVEEHLISSPFSQAAYSSHEGVATSLPNIAVELPVVLSDPSVLLSSGDHCKHNDANQQNPVPQTSNAESSLSIDDNVGWGRASTHAANYQPPLPLAFSPPPVDELDSPWR
ncbi:hypothetical protein K488DRAFT_89737 [Vararia minispora EC-137]|uniref:Uncharacterized protein n=1 Tax=Vararia minispora EC-137 TaxID=1314806 RepID=A0ACB8QA23_9AGAM|nr:hypothetical protein K488DRAFT_89737 [Vararia minispora EC-137]